MVLSFQYNVWAIPCNTNTECDDNSDEDHCNIANWHRWLAIVAILLFFSALFIGSLKFRLEEEVEKSDEIQLEEPDNSGPKSLKREDRFQLILILKDGGKQEAKRVYEYFCNEENLQIVDLKVPVFS